MVNIGSITNLQYKSSIFEVIFDKKYCTFIEYFQMCARGNTPRDARIIPICSLLAWYSEIPCQSLIINVSTHCYFSASLPMYLLIWSYEPSSLRFLIIMA